LGILTTTNILGIYSAIKVIIDLVVKFLNILSRVFFPVLNRKRNHFGKYKKLMLAVSTAFILMILLFHKLIFWYLNIDNNNAFLILSILAIGILGFAFYNVFGLNYFIIQRRDKLVMRNTIFSSLIGFLTAFPLIYYFGIIGAAINLSFSRWLMGGGLYFQYLKQTRFTRIRTKDNIAQNEESIIN
jgi:PST family polysaccharide transporter